MTASGPRFYYLGAWQQSQEDGYTVWTPPEHTVGLVDLRPLRNVESFGFFATDEKLNDSDYEYFGDVLDGNLTSDQRLRWASMLGLAGLQSSTILDALWETLTVAADPDGETHALPITPTHLGQMELHLGGHSLIRSRRFKGVDDPAWPVIQRVLQRSYRNIRADAQRMQGKHRQPDLHLKWLGAQRLKYKLTPEAARDLIGDKRDGLPKKPTTTISDDFNRSNATLSGTEGGSGGWYWWDMKGTSSVNNQNATNSSSYGWARSATDDSGSAGALSSSDHEATIRMVTVDVGAVVRAAADTDTCYTMYLSSTNIRPHTRVGGTITWGTSTAHSQTNTLQGTIRADGSTITYLVNGSAIITLTNTQIPGNVDAGYFIGTGGRRVDDFIALDLIATPEPIEASLTYLGSPSVVSVSASVTVAASVEATGAPGEVDIAGAVTVGANIDHAGSPSAAELAASVSVSAAMDYAGSPADIDIAAAVSVMAAMEFAGTPGSLAMMLYLLAEINSLEISGGRCRPALRVLDGVSRPSLRISEGRMRPSLRVVDFRRLP